MSISITDLKKGDIVRLASGSPKFTVENVYPDDKTVDLWGWHDRHGFLSEVEVPASFLVWPAAHRLIDGDETEA